MALTVEDGTGLTDADSYVAIVDVDQFWLDNGNPAEWSNASPEAKDAAARETTRYLDGQYGGRFTGKRSSREQALEWPRVGGKDRSGFAVASDAVPREVELASFLGCLKAISGSLLPDKTDSGVSMARDKVGELETERQYTGSGSGPPIYREIEDALQPILIGTRGQVMTQRS